MRWPNLNVEGLFRFLNFRFFVGSHFGPPNWNRRPAKPDDLGGRARSDARAISGLW